MGAITIVGLGPGDARHLTREAWDVLQRAPEIWLRTRCHPTVSELPAGLLWRSFDHLYDAADGFERVYRAIVDQLVNLAQRPEGVVYAVPGDPTVGEATVAGLRESAREAGLDIRIVHGLSFVEPTLAALKMDALAGLQICDALDLATRRHPPLNPSVPAMVAQLYSKQLASDCKLTLMNQYTDVHRVMLVSRAGTRDETVEALPLFELDRHHGLSHLTTLFVPALEGAGSFEDLQDTVARLRAPGGCPWDQEQTHVSLRRALLEEAYEVATAIDEADSSALQEELGDLLLQVVLHAQIATEEGEFTMPHVVGGIDRKLKHRHPHVWGDVTVRDAEDVVQRWERLKQAEKGESRSVLDGVPSALPALLQADLYGRRAARVGFDWPDSGGVVDKIREEIAELTAADSPGEREAELGDLLLAIANWARWLGVDPESALRVANARFARRFRAVEAAARQRGWDVAQRNVEELEALWEDAKAADSPV